MENLTFAQLANLNVNVWQTYKQDYPTDVWAIENINKDITFLDIVLTLVQPTNTQYEKRDLYEVIGVSDSLIREHIFCKLADLTGIDYATFYNLWINHN